jgi:hypothetical protein
MTCQTCPFSNTEQAETALNLGCLPDEYEIMQLKKNSNVNWCCHMDESKMCAGFIQACKDAAVDYKTGKLASYKKWYHEGVPC